ncbi:hypothetical protein HSX37_08340|uniref:Uncharacterized protein n=1 Tax=Dendrosporobacter quercicolus TaxID=146817 RepID=A0A1G9US16_9FIRM|nr:hypothetical protein [Dendrosporobacter quercicolus]NSL48051.1 hypothetical protein [Dendrosporobacter quercicolus DSM 1736]SDM62597.1 hypothetical protein SAMN04488502_10639 [Dendrosporobacter quercicolus]
MAKIPKNLSDNAMFSGFKEKATFETAVYSEAEEPVKPGKKEQKEDLATAFFTPEIQEKVGKALLEIKLELYKQGTIDYTIKVVRQGNQVILTAVPAKPKK